VGLLLVLDLGDDDLLDDWESIEHKSSKLFDARDMDSFRGAADCNCEALERDRGLMSTTGAGVELFTLGRIYDPVDVTLSRLSGRIGSLRGSSLSGVDERTLSVGVLIQEGFLSDCLVGGAGNI